MSIEVFNRYEKKFLVNQKTYEEIMAKLSDHMTLDAYNKENGFYTISNIYYDTETDDLIKKSLSKPVYKEKLRLRAYGVTSLDDKVYLEIKKKYKGLVNKRRTTLTLREAYAFIETQQMPEKKPYHNRQVLKEIAFFMQQYDLKASTYIAYDRKALFCEELRVTFDTNIRTRRADLGLELGDEGRPLLESGQWLMEVKAEKTLPMWFVRILSEYKIYSTSFSKYGKEYLTRNEAENTIDISKGDQVTCLSPYLIPQPAAR